MPQDVPLEASETLVFTPASLEALYPAPTFTLRVPTGREKRFLQRMHRENGVFTHNQQAFRDETLRGLRAQWTEEQFEQFSGWVTEYWDAEDAFAKLRQEDPDAVWVYDAEIERAVIDLQEKLEKSWLPLARMYADATEYGQMQPLFYAAVIVVEWQGLDVRRQLDRGYLTLDCAEALQAALIEFDKRAGQKLGTSMGELYLACLKRMYLDEEEGKNSASPSPSETTQEATIPTNTSEPAGKSQESTARSTKTPADA